MIKENTGTIRERNGKYYFRIYVTLSNGERKQIERLGGKTYKQAERAMLKFQIENENQKIPLSSKMFLFDFLDNFIEFYSINWNGNTLKTARRYVKMIKNNFANVRVNKITNYHLQNNFNILSRTYSKTTLKALKAWLNIAFDYAFKTVKIINENPVREVKVSGKEEKMKRAYTKEELILIKQNLKNRKSKKHYYLFMILLETGARIGEILALKWEDVDFENSKIDINKSLFFAEDGKAVLNSKPKTKNSTRNIYITKSIKDIFQTMKKNYENNKLEYAEYFNDSNFVFSNPNGDLPSYNIQLYLNSLIKKIVDINAPIHSLRHTHISHLIEQGVSLKVIQERVGHSNIRTTLNIYTHVTKNQEKEVVNHINFFE